MGELIDQEIIEKERKLTCDYIAGLEFAKKTINEMIIIRLSTKLSKNVLSKNYQIPEIFVQDYFILCIIVCTCTIILYLSLFFIHRMYCTTHFFFFF